MSGFSDQERTPMKQSGATSSSHHAAVPNHRNRTERFQWL